MYLLWQESDRSDSETLILGLFEDLADATREAEYYGWEYTGADDITVHVTHMEPEPKKSWQEVRIQRWRILAVRQLVAMEKASEAGIEPWIDKRYREEKYAHLHRLLEREKAGDLLDGTIGVAEIDCESLERETHFKLTGEKDPQLAKIEILFQKNAEEWADK